MKIKNEKVRETDNWKIEDEVAGNVGNSGWE